MQQQNSTSTETFDVLSYNHLHEATFFNKRFVTTDGEVFSVETLNQLFEEVQSWRLQISLHVGYTNGKPTTLLVYTSMGALAKQSTIKYFIRESAVYQKVNAPQPFKGLIVCAPPPSLLALTARQCHN